MMQRRKLKGLRCRTLAGLAVAVTILTAGCAHRGALTDAVADSDSPVMTIAHRGGAMLRPENTLPAFQHAAELGLEFIEFDMLMTADDRIVVYHDANINPDFCTPDAAPSAVSGATSVRGLSFDALQRFDCGSAARPAYAGEKFRPVPGARIPSLDKVLSEFRNIDARFFAETKIPQGANIDPVKFATLLNEAVLKYGLEDRLILQSFDFRTIDALHRINPRIRTCLLGAQKLTRDYQALLRQHNATCIVLDHTDIDRIGVRRLQDEGVLVFSGVVDTQEEWAKYAEIGVDAIFTNDPEGLIAFLEQSGLRPSSPSPSD